MSKYQEFCRARENEKRYRAYAEEVKRMLNPSDSLSPLGEFDEALEKLDGLLQNLGQDAYQWQDAVEQSFEAALSETRTTVGTERQRVVLAYEQYWKAVERARARAAQDMMDLVHSFQEGDWVECAMGEFCIGAKDLVDKARDLSRVKQKIHYFFKELTI